MKKINGVFLIALVGLLPLISMQFMAMPVMAQLPPFSSDLVGNFDGLEPGESLTYKVWIPQSMENWINDQDTINALLYFLNTTIGIPDATANQYIYGLNDFVNNLLGARLNFSITEVIQPNTSTAWPYGHIVAMMNLENYNSTQLYNFLTLLGLINPGLFPLLEFLAVFEKVTTEMPVTLDTLSLLQGGQAIYPDRPTPPAPTDIAPITLQHYQPQDLTPHPLHKTTDYAQVKAFLNMTNSLDSAWLEHNATGAFQNESYDFSFSNYIYFNNVNITNIGPTDYWQYRIHVNDTLGNYTVTPWHIKQKNGTIPLPLIMPNNWDYWAGFFDGFMTAFNIFQLISGLEIIQNFDVTLGLNYTTNQDGSTQTHDAVHFHVDLSTKTLTRFILETLIGMPSWYLSNVFGSWANYLNWVDGFRLAPIILESYSEIQHGFLLRADINNNISHIMNQWTIFIVNLLTYESAPQALIDALTNATALLGGIGELGFGIELSQYTEFPDMPTLSVMPPDVSTDGRVFLNWTESSGAATYYIYRNDTLLATSNNSDYIDRTGDGDYSYYVIAGNQYANSTQSNTVTIAVRIVPNLWWLWLLIGGGVGAGIAIAVIYARTRRIWWFERETIVTT